MLVRLECETEWHVVSVRSVPGTCNAYLPEDTTLNRFMWVVDYFAQQGFYIILDNQFNLDQTATQNTQTWLNRVLTPLSRFCNILIARH